jgi:endonuclease/exonuclease/phosphatase family metal-dependent hydrolase
VDSPSWWSGGFDHASVVAAAGAFSYRAQASHAHLLIASYGTAVLSRLPIDKAAAVDFAPSPPTAGKGFTIAQINWHVSADTQLLLDVVSIHMDFSRASVRESQLAELEAVLETRHNPLLIMGDFNSEELAQRLVDATAANERRLHTAVDHAGVHTTYKGKRLDWIIASGELEFVDYHTDPTMLSDHRAVIASIALRVRSEE